MVFRGAIFETMIVDEFFKSIANRCSRERLYYYRASNRNEIDIVLQNGKDTLLCEIKSGATFSGDWVKTMERLHGQFGDNVRMKVIYGGEESQKLYSNLNFLDTDLLCLKFASLAESRHCRIPSLRNAAIAECRYCEKLLLRKTVVVTFRYCRNVTLYAIQNKFSLIETELASCERKVSADAGRAYCRKSKRSDAGHTVACTCDAF